MSRPDESRPVYECSRCGRWWLVEYLHTQEAIAAALAGGALERAPSGREATAACVGCGGPHPFDTSIPSPMWNRVIRGAGLPDYLCTTCIVRAFALAGESFTAELWGGEFDGIPIEVRVRSAAALAAAAVLAENNTLRSTLSRLRDDIDATLADVTRPTVALRARQAERDEGEPEPHAS